MRKRVKKTEELQGMRVEGEGRNAPLERQTDFGEAY